MKNYSKQFLLLLLSVITIALNSCSSSDDPFVVIPTPTNPTGTQVNLTTIPASTTFTPTNTTTAVRTNVSKTFDVLSNVSASDKTRLTVELISGTSVDLNSDKTLTSKLGLPVGTKSVTYKVFETSKPTNFVNSTLTFTIFYDSSFDNTTAVRHTAIFDVTSPTSPIYGGNYGGSPNSTPMTKLCGTDKDGNLMVFYDRSNGGTFEGYHSRTTQLYSHYKNNSSLDVNLVYSDKYIMVKKLRYNVDPVGVYRYVYNEDVTKIVSDTTTVTKPTLLFSNGTSTASKIIWIKL